MAFVDGLRVIRSPIHGYGIVALRAFAKGEVVCTGEGILYDEDAEFDDTYALIFDGDTVEPAVAGSVFYDLVCQTRWINHSCEPNTEIETTWSAERQAPIPMWIATRDIAPGEELTYDYAFDPSCAERCGCGAPRCRGVIVDADCIHELDSTMTPFLRT